MRGLTGTSFEQGRSPFKEIILQLRSIALSPGLVFVLATPQLSFARNAERDTAFAMALARQWDMDKSGMVSKTNSMKMMEAKWDEMAKGAKELSVANTAMIFMDGYSASN